MKNPARRFLPLLLLLLMLPIYYWFAAGLGSDLFKPARHLHTENFYDQQAQSILLGRLNVPPMSIGHEAISWKGRTYGYYGITPSILRIPLRLLFPSTIPFTRAFVLLYSFGTLILSCCLLMFFLGRAKVRLSPGGWVLVGLFLLTLGLGSINLFIASGPTIYHEATACSCFFAMLAWCFLTRYNFDNGPLQLAAALFCALLSANARPFAGLGVLLASAVLVAGKIWGALPAGGRGGFTGGVFSFLGVEKLPGPEGQASPARAKTIGKGFGLLMIIGLVVLSPALVNYAKFDSLTKVPRERYFPFRVEPERFQRTGGEQFFHQNFFLCFSSYFGLSGMSARVGWPPSVEIAQDGTEQARREHPRAVLDKKEMTVSLPWNSPLLALLTLTGIAALFIRDAKGIRLLRLQTAASFAGASFLLFYYYVSHRYLYDFYPFLLFSGIAGMCYVLQGPKRLPLLLVPVFLLLAAWSVLINLALCRINANYLLLVEKMY